MKKTFSAVLLCIAIMCCVLCGCGQKSVNLDNVQSDEIQFQQPKQGDIVAEIKTNKGSIKVVLYPQQAPLAVENFVTHAKNGYYDGVVFHRVIEDFVIQSGDPEGTGSGGNSIWELPFSDEYSDLLHHYTGALSMANSGKDTNRSQFFIVTSLPESIDETVVELMTQAGWREEIIQTYKQSGGTPNLDYRYTVFGQVYEGMDVAFDISYVKTDENDRPVDDVIIETIEISQIE